MFLDLLMISVLLVFGLLYFEGFMVPWSKVNPPLTGVLISTELRSALPAVSMDLYIPNTQQVIYGKSCAASASSLEANTDTAAFDCSGGGRWIPVS